MSLKLCTHVQFLLFLFVLIVTNGCITTQPPLATVPNHDSLESHNTEIGGINYKLFKQQSTSFTSPYEYLIGPSDLLEVKVLESEKLTTTERVNSKGYVNLPLLDDVQVGNLNPIEAAERIESLLREGGYINDPHVNVFIQEHKSRTVSVVGSVNEPGNYELIGRLTLLDALAMSKGLNQEAGTTAYISRTEESGEKKIIAINLDHLFHKGQASSENVNLPLQAGDIVYVTEAGNVFVQGAVKKPGSVNIIEGQTTVSQSIIDVGGLASFANDSNVKLIRDLGSGNREITDLDLGEIQSGVAEDPLVKDRDVIVVGASGLKKLVYGLNVHSIFFGFGYNPPQN